MPTRPRSQNRAHRPRPASSGADVRGRAVDGALLIHDSDAASAIAAGVRGDLPRRAAVLATAISGVNVVLAALAPRNAPARM